MIRIYSQLKLMSTFEERFAYLKLTGDVGKDTFGFDRIFNQRFYHQSKAWRDVRRQVILRDMGCDLGMADNPIMGRVIVHHMNPITLEDIQNNSEYLLDPNYLICVSHSTHNAIHYGTEINNNSGLVVRTPNDTCPWKR